MAEDQQPQDKAPKQPKAKEAKPEQSPAPSEDVRKLTSVLQAQKAQADKRAEAVERELAEAREHLRLMKEAGQYGEDVEAQTREIAKLRTALDRDREVVQRSAKQITIRGLVQRYGVAISTEELDTMDDPTEMRAYAAERYVEYLEAQAQKQLKAPPHEEPEEKRPPSGFDTGEPTVRRKSVADMTDAEFATYWKTENTRALANKARART